MAFHHKDDLMKRRNDAVHAQNQRSRLTSTAHSGTDETLRQQVVAVSPVGVLCNQSTRHSTRALARHQNPGPNLLQGSSLDELYVNVYVFNVEFGLPEAYHYDCRHHNPDWIWDSSVTDYIPRNHGMIDEDE